MIGAPTPMLGRPFTTWFGMHGRVAAGVEGRHAADLSGLYPYPLRGRPCAIALVAVSIRPPGKSWPKPGACGTRVEAVPEGASFGRLSSGRRRSCLPRLPSCSDGLEPRVCVPRNTFG